MANELEDAKLKLSLAKKHLQTLKTEIADYIKTHPYEFTTVNDGNLTTATKEAVIKIHPPKELSLTVGSCVGALREVLEYIAWAIAKKYASTPPEPGKDKSIQFPIFDSPTADKTNFNRMAAKYSFPAPVVTLIENVQPYNVGYELLKSVAALSNQNKHCTLILTSADSKTLSFKIFSDKGSVLEGFGKSLHSMSIGNNQVAFVIDTHAHADEIAMVKMNVTGVDEGEPQTIQVNGDVAVFVSLKDGLTHKPIEQTLEEMISCVAGIITQFEPHF